MNKGPKFSLYHSLLAVSVFLHFCLSRDYVDKRDEARQAREER